MIKVPTNINCDRLTLRKFQLSDAAAIFKNYASDPEVTKYVSWPTHQSIEDTYDFLKYVSESWEQQKDFSFAIIEKESGELIGGVGFVNEGGKIAVGYVIGKMAWGKGYATEASMAIVEWLKAEQQFYRIWAYCDVDHDNSANVLRKVGFKREALISNWCIFPNQQNQAKDCLFFVLP